MHDNNEIEVTKPPEAIDELALQNVIRKRHCKDWPNVVLQLTKRVQAVNQTWAKIIMQLITIPGLSVTWKKEEDSLVLIVSVSELRNDKREVIRPEEVERHEITAKELYDARQYIEVFLMDKLDHSELIEKAELPA